MKRIINLNRIRMMLMTGSMTKVMRKWIIRNKYMNNK